MNMISKKINAIFLATVIASTPAYAAEVQQTEQQDTAQTSVVWYKKRSTHLVAAIAATAVGIYALAVRKNKVAGPMALIMGVFCANKKAQEVKNADEAKDSQDKQMASAQEDIEDTKSESVISEDQKIIVTQEKETILSETKEENNQPTHEASLYMRAQEYASDALGGLKNWFKKGLVDDDFSNN